MAAGVVTNGVQDISSWHRVHVVKVEHSHGRNI